MPLLKIQTNQAADAEKTKNIMEAMTELVVTELNKPKGYVQVILEPGRAQAFAGTDQPNAFVELRSLGLTEDKTKPLSRAICRLVETQLAVPPERVFINFFDMPRPMWGWKNDTFG